MVMYSSVRLYDSNTYIYQHAIPLHYGRLSSTRSSCSSNDISRLFLTLSASHKMWRSRLSHVVVAICAIVPAMADHLFAREIEGGNTTFGPLPAESYFREPTAVNSLHSHIALMSLSWIGAFPVCK